MPDLIAQGPEPQQRWRRPLPEGQWIVIGRGSSAWSVPWDDQISRRHVRLRWTGRVVEATREPKTRNPVYLRGRELERFELRPGEHFVIGQTSFALSQQQVALSATMSKPARQQSFSSQYLRQMPFRNPDRRMEVLSRLPEVIGGAAGDQELFVRLVTMLLAGIPRAHAAAVVDAGGAEPDAAGADMKVLHWDQRLAVTTDFEPSRGLIVEAVRHRQSVLHVWSGLDSSRPGAFTAHDSFDWAFCTPITGKGCAGWGVYVAGRFTAEAASMAGSSDPTDLREDVKFTELVAAILSALRAMRLLEHRQAALSQFFAPVVLDSLAMQDPDEMLAPREADVSVIFCDLRGFGRASEQSADDLLGLLERVSRALGVMTRHIREHGGVIGDFQGDAALGFWGWPIAQDDTVERTYRAALAIRGEFEAAPGFRAGIGVASGRAVAGKLGTADQVKVTVFGPVVNLAARLEGMTRELGASILLDEPTAEAVRRRVSAVVARVRRLARVLPYGLQTPLTVSELLPPAADSALTDRHLADYEAALDRFVEGDWPAAFELLHRIPPADRAKDFLTAEIARHNRTAPAGFDGVIHLERK
ncbi:MAG: adenylate/guanylate cyclase domain-containing protein [Pirellulales bacterium]